MNHADYEIRCIARRGFYKLIEAGTERSILEGFFKDCASPNEYNKFVKFMERTGNDNIILIFIDLIF